MSDVPDRSRILTMMTSSTREDIWPYKDIRDGSGTAFTAIAGKILSLWTGAGQPGHGVAPGGTARNPTNATAGAFAQTDAVSPAQKYLVDIFFHGGNNAFCGAVLYDRLADISGLSGTVTTAQTISGLSAARYTGTAAAGNLIMVEVYTAIGVTATTITASYTNQAGVSGQTTPATNIGGVVHGRAAGAAFLLPLAQGDTGVRSVESVTLAGTTGTAGDFGVTIFRPLATMMTDQGGTFGLASEPMIKGLTPIKAGACLTLYAWYSATTATPIGLQLKMGEF